MDKTVEEQINVFLCNVRESVKAAYSKGYKNGLNDGNINDGTFAAKVKEAYNNGLNDAWKCARKIYDMPCDVVCELFPDSGDIIFADVTASEAIARIKKYEDRQKKADEIHVGDEIYCLDSKNKYAVLGFLDNDKIFAFSSRGFTGVFASKQVYKTGRNYPVKEILEELKNDKE